MRSHIELGMPVDYEVQQRVKLLFISVSTYSVDEGLVIILVIQMRCMAGANGEGQSFLCSEGEVNYLSRSVSIKKIFYKHNQFCTNFVEIK